MLATRNENPRRFCEECADRAVLPRRHVNSSSGQDCDIIAMSSVRLRICAPSLSARCCALFGVARLGCSLEWQGMSSLKRMDR